MDTGAYLGTKGWIQGHILGEITDLEFENLNCEKVYFQLSTTSETFLYGNTGCPP